MPPAPSRSPEPPAATFRLASEATTKHLAGLCANGARPGDCFLLEGPLGSGKSAFARAFIRYLNGPNTEVPSPTFTLVQPYETPAGELWHADLYRLSGPDDVEETGLLDALPGIVALIEWPDRLGAETPMRYVRITLVPVADSDTARQAEIRVEGEGWEWLQGALAEMRE